MLIPLRIPIYQRQTGGFPSTTVVVDDIASAITSYQHAISATFGFESMSCTVVTDLTTAMEILTSWLMHSTIVTDAEGAIVWEGYITQIDATFGQKARSLSLDAMANRVRCKYTTVLGTPGVTSALSDATSQGVYGIKDVVVELETTDSTSATNEATKELAAMKNPRAVPKTDAMTGAPGGIEITLTFAGWYAALGWTVTSNAATSTAVTTTQVQTLLTAYDNGFISGDYSHIVASGISSPQKIEDGTTFRDAIEQRLRLGNGFSRYAWGVYEDRTFYADAWAGTTPSSTSYRGRLSSGQVYDAVWNVVAPWNVRPNAMYEESDLLDPAPVASAADAAARFFVERVTCTISKESVGCTLEPAAFDSTEVRLARLKRTGVGS